MSRQKRPELWSDFDGTVVETLPLFHPRNWIKFPLAIMPGYADFLASVKASGVTIGGIISKRPSMFRYWPTLFTIRSLRLDSYFYGKRIVLSGTNRGKGRFIANRARSTAVGMIEDKPHKLLPPLLTAIDVNIHAADNALQPILIGVVDHPRSHQYLRTALQRAERSHYQIKRLNSSMWQVFIPGAEATSVRIVLLKPYNKKSGQAFARLLKTS